MCMAAGPMPQFEVKPPQGVDFILQNSPTPQKYLIETMPGGVALLDYNNDGLLDIFLVNGGRVTSPMQSPENFDRKDPRYWNRLYRQNKDGSFIDVTEQAGLAKAGDGNYGMGVAVGDYDNDGYPDLYVTSYGKNILYHNNGDGTFTDVTAKAGVAGGGWSVSAGFFDYDNDGSWICSSHGTWNGTPNTVRAAAASGIRIVHRKSFRPRPTFFITTTAMVRLRTLVRNLASPPRRAVRLEWHSQITMTTGLQTYSSPTMACSNISFITMAMELSQNGLSKPVLDCPKMAGVYPAWA